VIIAEASQVQVIVVRQRASAQQQPRDLGIRPAGDRAAQRLPAAFSDHAIGVCPGVEQQHRHRDKPVRSARVEAIPPRRAGGVQRGPSGRRVGASHQAWVSFESGPNPLDVAEYHGSRQVVARKLWSRLEHPGRAAGPVPDACPTELICQLGQFQAARLNLGLELGPAREAVLARHRELSGGQVQLIADSVDAFDCCAIARSRGAQQISGLTAQVVEIRLGWKHGHDVSPTALEVRAPGRSGSRMLSLGKPERWTKSCPRTRRRPCAPRATLAQQYLRISTTT
jgi:hypothetical protein